MIDGQLPPDSVGAILFDLDGTLVQTNDHWLEAMAGKLAPIRRLFPQLDPDLLARRLLMCIETPVNYFLSILEHLGLGTGFFGLTNRLRRSKGLATREDRALIEGTEGLLTALSDDYRLAIVTTRGRPEAHALLRQTALDRFFDVVVTRQDILRMKPHPEPVRKAAAHLGLAPQHCLMIGDTGMDIRSAKRAGAYAVGVLSGVGARTELERAGANLILGRASELLDHLQTS